MTSYTFAMPGAVIAEEAKCLDCNYALRGLTDFRCPECGRAFNPERPLSLNVGRPLDPFARWAMRPMGRAPRVAMWALVASGVVGPAWLFPAKELACLWLLLWLGLFTVCWLRSFARAAVVRLYRQPEVLLRVDNPLRRKLRIAFAASLLLLLTRLPFLLTVIVSRPWLDPYVWHAWAEIPATEPLPSRPTRCGLVLVHPVSDSGPGFTLHCFGGDVPYAIADDGESLRIDWAWWGWRDRWDVVW
jgi:hypothetical protein